MTTVRILKLGGSLLSLADWPERLHGWLARHPAPLSLVLVGGGEIVEAVRELDSHHHFPASFTHWLCIDLLSATARIASQLLPTFPLLSSSEDLQRIVSETPFVAQRLANSRAALPHPQDARVYVVDVTSFYQRPAVQATPGHDKLLSPASTQGAVLQFPTSYSQANVGKRAECCPLPENWSTTSDSLAAWLAVVVGANELVLFKSTTPEGNCSTPQAWVEQGIVDAAFAATLPTHVSVQIVNLLLATSAAS